MAMTMEQSTVHDPYEVLGVSMTASLEEIKVAYRRLAKQHHPDLRPGDRECARKFNEINSAYRSLQQGTGTSRPSGGGTTGREPATCPVVSTGKGVDMFRNLFGNFEDWFAGQHHDPAGDLHFAIDIGFLDAALGARKIVAMPDGQKVSVVVPAGATEGQKLKLKGKGRQTGNGCSGNAYVKLRIRPHKYFRRIGNDVHGPLRIGIHEAALGGKVEVETIHGIVRMTLPKGTSSGKRLRIVGKGIKGGDHYAKVLIVMPTRIDRQLEAALKDWATIHAYNPRAIRRTPL